MAKGEWIGKARRGMEQKNTVGSFGKATSKKIAAGKRAGGLQKKKAVFAQSMRKIAARRKHAN